MLAFLDIHPLCEGHVLLIPKEEAATVDKLSDESAAAIGRVLPRLSRAVMKATGVSEYNILQNNGAGAHQAVFHVHFHIIPKYKDGQGLGIGWKPMSLAADRAKQLATRSPSTSELAVAQRDGQVIARTRCCLARARARLGGCGSSRWRCLRGQLEHVAHHGERQLLPGDRVERDELGFETLRSGREAFRQQRCAIQDVRLPDVRHVEVRVGRDDAVRARRLLRASRATRRPSRSRRARGSPAGRVQ